MEYLVERWEPYLQKRSKSYGIVNKATAHRIGLAAAAKYPSEVVMVTPRRKR